MNTWILIILVYAGAMAKGDSVTLSSIEFSSEQSCKEAGEKAKSLTIATYKETRYICVKK